MAAKGAKNKIKSVWMVTREYEGLAGAGGVKDVSRQLAEALARSGCSVTVVLPLYGFIDPSQLEFTQLEDESFAVDMDYVGAERRETVFFWERRMQQVRILLVDAERFRNKQGVYTYTAAEEAANHFHVRGNGHFDYFAMNVLLQKAALDLMLALDIRPDVIHCHDGHAALIPAMIREKEGYRSFFRNTGAVVTIHNAGRGYHQDVDDISFAVAVSGLSERVVSGNLLEERFDPLLAASSYAVVNTVSENYARELQETDDDELTGGLGHALAERDVVLRGVTNGIDPTMFDPRKYEESGIAAAFDPATGDMAGKSKCRQDLVEMLSSGTVEGARRTGKLDLRPDVPLFAFIGRLTAQKGVDKLIDALEILLPNDPDFQVLVLGTGDKGIENGLLRLAGRKKNKGRICVLRGYGQHLANKIYAASDFFVIPSRYEPCGLTDFIAQLYGSVPVVHHVGGLVKVINDVTGFAYRDHSSAALMGTMQKALRLFRGSPEQIAAMRQAAIEEINAKYTWDTVVERYFDLYDDACRMCD